MNKPLSKNQLKKLSDWQKTLRAPHKVEIKIKETSIGTHIEAVHESGKKLDLSEYENW